MIIRRGIIASIRGRSSRVSSPLTSVDVSPLFQRSFVTGEKKVLYDVVPKSDFGQYQEYSVIFTNRALNLMSDPFQKVMRDLNTLLKETYNARKVAIIPG